MVFIFLLLVFLLLSLIHTSTKDPLIYEKCPANYNYTDKYIRIIITFARYNRVEFIEINNHTINKIFYISNKISSQEAVEYISKHKELYIDEFNKYYRKYIKEYSPEIITYHIRVELYDK